MHAGPDLRATGRLHACVLKAAGTEMGTFLEEILRDGGQQRVGEVVETPGCRLPCKQVLHVVCPKWPAGGTHARQQGCLDDLQKAFDNVLAYAIQSGAGSIALSLLGSGSMCIPIERVARVIGRSILTTTTTTISASQDQPLEIHVVCRRADRLLHVINAFREYARASSCTVPMTESVIQGKLSLVCAGATAASPPNSPQRISLSTHFEPRSYKIGANTTVVLHMAEIHLLHVDAIISPDNCQLERASVVAKNIGAAAGGEMTTFVHEIIHNRLTVGVGEVVQTPPGRLPCTLVFHAVPPPWPGNDNPTDVALCLMKLKETYDNIFEEARQSDVTTMAIPSFTGLAGLSDIPPIHIAEKVYRAIMDNEGKQRSGLAIHLVDTVPDVLNIIIIMLERAYREPTATNLQITSADSETQLRIARARHGNGDTAASSTELSRNNSLDRYTPEPRLSTPRLQTPVNSPHIQSLQEFTGSVGYIIKDLSQGTDVNIILHVGRIATLKVDAIVNPTDGRLKHQRGVSQAIYADAGPKVKEEGQRIIKLSKIPVGGVIHTGSGNLPCSTVLHVVPPKWPPAFMLNGQMVENVMETTKCMSKLTVALQNIFSKALELSHIRSIALPPIYSTKFPVPVHYLADGIREFLLNNQSVRRMREVYIVDTNEHFLRALHARLDEACRIRSPYVQVSPMGPDVMAVLDRVTTSSSSEHETNDKDLYSEIPAGSAPWPSSPSHTSKTKKKLTKLTGRLTRLVPKRQKDDSATSPPALPTRTPSSYGVATVPPRQAETPATPPLPPARRRDDDTSSENSEI